MKRAGNLFNKVTHYENLLLAHKKALMGSGKNEEACRFTFYLERELLTLQDDLIKGVYRPGRYRYFKIFDPKERTISVAPFRDRVVHHAIVNVLEPVFERVFIFDSYANRKNKGTHRAVTRAQSFMKNSNYYLKFDVDKYFYNIDHHILIRLIERKIKDRQLIDLLSVIIANNDVSQGTNMGVGLPIGNLTSQFFANVYLDVFDHYVKEELRVKRYIRYMDDCVVLHDDREYLKSILKQTESFFQNQLKLKLKESATFLNSRMNGLPFLGYRVFPSLIRIKRENVKRLKKKLAAREQQFKKGVISEERFSMSLASLIGHTRFADSLQLRRCLFHGLAGSGL